MRRLALILALAGCTEPAPIAAPASLPQLANAIAFMPNRNNPLCAITKVVDGDTVVIRCATGGGNARLTGFDTPETYQSGCAAEKRLGLKAKQYLADVLSSAQSIGPRLKGTDKYDRLLVELIVDGRPLSQIMIEKGLAVPYQGGRRIDWCRKLSA